MPIYKIRGIDVDFPLEAYDCQIVYMEKVIQSLQEGRNALLESPTGTGKTLCLLCATLAWRKSFGDFSTIEYVKKHHGLGNEPFDIEDLVNIGRTKGPCPYYVSRELHKTADILFAPYNYLIDPGNRRSLTGIPWSNAVLIFDEAHNLESICADAASFDLPSSYLTACISEAKQCIDICIAKRAIDKSADKQLDPENYAILRALLLKLEKRIAEVAIESKELGFTRPGNYIYEFLSDLNITYETANMLISTIDNASLLLEEDGSAGQDEGYFMQTRKHKGYTQYNFQDGGRVHAKYYRVIAGKGSRTLSWWCFNPGLAMEEFVKLGIRSIILTSGTLSPLDSFAMELNLEFPVRLENPHVISSNQICVGVVPTGPSGYPFNSSYRTRDSLEYKQELGNAIVNFARIVPDGLLVFFPSYFMMDQCIECWKSMSHASSAVLSTIWERICKHKQPVVEPKQSSLFPHAIEDFETKLRDSSTSGAIFFAVCRGKVWLDFADQAGRAVVITGMPFSMKTDPKVRLKREYLDQQAQSVKKDSKALTGEEWYVQQATRAVNQAVGRVLRHRHDYGAIIFCDERFAQQNHQSQMSYWLRPHIKCYTKFGDVVFTLTRFFREKDSFGPLRPKQPEISKTGKNIGRLNCVSIMLPASTAENYVTKSSLVIPAIVTDNSYDQFGHIVPANRSNLSNKYINHTSQHSGDQFSFRKRSGENENNKRNSQYQDDEVIDLTGDALLCKKSAEDVMTPISFKKLKLYERSNVMVESRNASSSKLLHNVDSTFSLEKSPGDRSSEKGNKKISQLPSGDPVGFGANSNYEEAQSHQGGTKSSSFPSGDEETRGSAFLTQVQEKLTATEYKEFVGFMKALKLKTMKISPVLESIARLFSSPGRLSLLKRFKDFVPAKYHDIYEQLLRTHGAADNT
uniref:Regulator of telomere elongation helicase 1 homolog n=1 Tax=Ananas comosus var. bracteatus TaxID=296719 RepID=A0A6V7P085_ANACO|nr:unnamed protein product [Ananas comosus var. bracteatus]